MDLLNEIHTVISTVDKTPAVLSQSIQATGAIVAALSLSNSGESLGQSDAQTVLNITEQLMTQAATSLDTVASLGDLTSGLFSILPSTQFASMERLSSTLINSASQFALPGADPVVITTDNLEMEIGTAAPAAAALMVNQGECVDLSSGFELSPSFYATVLGTTDADVVQYQITKFTQNIWSSGDVVSDIVRLKVLGGNAENSTLQVLPVNNLPDVDHVLIYLPLTSPIPEGKQPFCGFWSAENSRWLGDGCSFIEVIDYGCTGSHGPITGQSVKCKCSHLTDFSVILQDAPVSTSGGWSNGRIIGTVVPTVLGICVCMALLVFLRRQRSSAQKHNATVDQKDDLEASKRIGEIQVSRFRVADAKKEPSAPDAPDATKTDMTAVELHLHVSAVDIEVPSAPVRLTNDVTQA